MPTNTQPLVIRDLKNGESHLIEANAGTGKTYAIANLFLRFVLEGTTVNNILVVTFTNATRDELRIRLQNRLNDALNTFQTGNIPDNADEFFASITTTYNKEDSCQHIKLALLSMNEAAIQTIHGFCQQTLTEHAIGTQQLFKTEHTNDAEIINSAINDWWRNRTYNFTQKELLWYKKNIFKDISAFENTISPLLKNETLITCIPHTHKFETTENLEAHITNHLKKIITEWKVNGEEIKTLLSDTDGTRINRKKPAYNKNGLKSFYELMDSFVIQEKTIDFKLTLNLNEKQLKPYGNTESDNNTPDVPTKSETFNRPLFQLIGELNYQLFTLYRLIEVNQAANEIRIELSKTKIENGMLSYNDMINNLYHAINNDADASLAHSLATQYPIIMIDEFQDTDPRQYEIFNSIHQSDKKTIQQTLIMIGDPKQAIYSFRGGDIFTYMQASDNADNHWNLSINWRSTPALIKAVNSLFSCDNAFSYKEIPYHRSEPPEDCQAVPLLKAGKEFPALAFEAIPKAEDDQLLSSKASIHNVVHTMTARRIATMLNDDELLLDNNRLAPGDIAVLVRTKSEASELQQELRERGIHSVAINDLSVWDTEEATSMEYFIQAIISPDNKQFARQALTAPILNLNLSEINSLQSTLVSWSNWVELLHTLNETWQKKGFMACYYDLLDNLSTLLPILNDKKTTETNYFWLSRSNNPERMLTNMGHIAELLQQASHAHPGMKNLLVWMQSQKNKNVDETHQLRLESDEKLVKIMTLHISKGLQFPVVFLPYLWHCYPVNFKSDSNLKLQWHESVDSNYQYFYNPFGTTSDNAFIHAERERLAEDMRLTYVALTRAKSHCHVIFGPTQSDPKFRGHPGRTGLSWLQHQMANTEDTEADNQDDFPFSPQPESINLAIFKAASDAITILPPDSLEDEITSTQKKESLSLQTAKFNRKLGIDWRINSFSSLTRDIHQSTQVARTEAETYALGFAAGKHVGNFLHKLLEKTDPARSLKEQLEPMARFYLSKNNITPEPDIDLLTQWLEDIYHTPLDTTGLTLAKISPDKQVPEMDFDFSTHRVGRNILHDCISRHTDQELNKVEFQAFEGMITGSIDLAFEYNEKYFILDYKSNRLGYRLDDYKPEHLADEIYNRRYDLQYLIYSLALHRHLKNRLQDYNYERDFGGVYYLFLRALTPDTGMARGVFFTKPSSQLIDELDQQVFARPETEIA